MFSLVFDFSTVDGSIKIVKNENEKIKIELKLVDF